MAFRNRGDLTFEDASDAWRFDIGEDISHGMANADLDGDGDLDVVINRLGKPAAVLRNDATAARIAVRLKGAPPNTSGIGSRVRVLGGAVPMQQREMVAGGLYLSSSDALLTFATGDAQQVRIEVDWRDGRRSVIEGAAAKSALRDRPDVGDTETGRRHRPRPGRCFRMSQRSSAATRTSSRTSMTTPGRSSCLTPSASWVRESPGATWMATAARI